MLCKPMYIMQHISLLPVFYPSFAPINKESNYFSKLTSILNGFQENEILPTGGISVGSTLGSILAYPFGLALAAAIGKILISSFIFNSFPFFLVKSQKEVPSEQGSHFSLIEMLFPSKNCLFK